MKSKSEIDGQEANLQTSKAPIFYFYFEDKTDSKLSNTSASNTAPKNDFAVLMQSYSPQKSNTAFSPNDFKLLKLDRSRKARYFETGTMSGFSGSSTGISKNVQSFKYVEIGPNLYKVYFPNGLPVGEYCFIYAASAGSGGPANGMMNNMMPQFKSDVKVFDFGVK